MTKQVTVTIDGQIISVPEGTTILQACGDLKIEVPVFCYHPRLEIAGNCRMCLVEVEKMPKPVASCAMPVSDGMIVHTKSPMVQQSRKGVLEFLLINHPLDCPICDQGGECDLQDITVAYGPSSSRFGLNKRIVPEKEMGPLIKTMMNRCIHCTRCVRFATEIAGCHDIGAIHRGEDTEITTLQQAVTSELSGNLIDVCPVGALTSKPYAFRYRSWELTKTNSIDVLDAVGSNIRIDSKGNKVMRILPRVHEDINEEWISDKTRFACDGLANQRLDTPYVRHQNKLIACDWATALQHIKEKFAATHRDKVAALTGNLSDVESVYALRVLLEILQIQHRDCRQDSAQYYASHRTHFIMNTPIADIEKSDCIIVVGSNPKHEAPLINARIRKRFLKKNVTIALVGVFIIKCVRWLA